MRAVGVEVGAGVVTVPGSEPPPLPFQPPMPGSGMPMPLPGLPDPLGLSFWQKLQHWVNLLIWLMWWFLSVIFILTCVWIFRHGRRNAPQKNHSSQNAKPQNVETQIEETQNVQVPNAEASNVETQNEETTSTKTQSPSPTDFEAVDIRETDESTE